MYSTLIVWCTRAIADWRVIVGAARREEAGDVARTGRRGLRRWGLCSMPPPDLSQTDAGERVPAGSLSPPAEIIVCGHAAATDSNARAS